jgi:hypothetical protein
MAADVMDANGVANSVASCHCGKLAIEFIGRPIVGAVCRCASCQEAGRQFQRSSVNGTILDGDGGTPAVLYRKDRATCIRGHDLLEEHRLRPASKTRRVVATCCGTPMFVDFMPGHWLSIYRARLNSDAPRKLIEARSIGFMLKLFTSWTAMGFRSPKITWGRL